MIEMIGKKVEEKVREAIFGGRDLGESPEEHHFTTQMPIKVLNKHLLCLGFDVK